MKNAVIGWIFLTLPIVAFADVCVEKDGALFAMDDVFEFTCNRMDEVTAEDLVKKIKKHQGEIDGVAKICIKCDNKNNEVLSSWGTIGLKKIEDSKDYAVTLNGAPLKWDDIKNIYLKQDNVMYAPLAPILGCASDRGRQDLVNLSIIKEHSDSYKSLTKLLAQSDVKKKIRDCEVLIEQQEQMMLNNAIPLLGQRELKLNPKEDLKIPRTTAPSTFVLEKSGEYAVTVSGQAGQKKYSAKRELVISIQGAGNQHFLPIGGGNRKVFEINVTSSLERPVDSQIKGKEEVVQKALIQAPGCRFSVNVNIDG